MKAPTAARLAWAAFGFVILCFMSGLALSVLNATGPQVSDRGQVVGEALLSLAMLSFPVVGVLIATRQPRNAVGWILLAIGVVSQLPMEGYVHYAFVTDPGSLPRPDLVAVLTSGMWVPYIGVMGTFLLLLFPDGHLPSRRWTPLAWLSAVVMILLTVGIPVTPDSLPVVAETPFLPHVPNPLGIEALRPVLGGLYGLLLVLPLCMVGCVLSLIVRFRRSHGHERMQLKWLAAGGGLAAVLYLPAIAFAVPYGWGGNTTPVWLAVLQALSTYAFVLIPVAIGFAVLRYRLYDIDVIINRTLVYGALTAVLALVYVGGVVGVGHVLRSMTGEESNNLVVAGSTLAVAALFRPARTRIQSFIDRRFYRRKYDVEQTLAHFSARLRDQIDLDALNTELLAVVTRTMQPTHASLWLRLP